jgi:hypothetical protein
MFEHKLTLLYSCNTPPYPGSVTSHNLAISPFGYLMSVERGATKARYMSESKVQDEQRRGMSRLAWEWQKMYACISGASVWELDSCADQVAGSLAIQHQEEK